jgi:hypothetical protein
MRDRNLFSATLEIVRARENLMRVGSDWLNRPGGHYGRLPQNRVGFDEDERVCLDFPTSGSITSGSTIITNLNRIRAWLSPAKWFLARATDPPSMYLYVEPGIAYWGGCSGSYILWPGGLTSGSFEHNTSGSPRIDILAIDSQTGLLGIVQGSAGSPPTAPWPLSGSPFPIAEVYMRPCSGSIFNKCSSGSATDNYIYRDVRPFLACGAATGGGGGGGLVNHTHTALDGGQLDWDDIWTDGVHAHTNAAEGGQVDHGNLLGLADDDHPQYIKDTEYTAKGDILAGTGAGTYNAQALGNNREFLMVNGAAADGVQWHPAPYWSNVVVVEPDGGEYDTIADAMAAITDAASDNPYTILVGAGVYEYTAAETWKDWVSIMGMGREATILENTSTSDDIHLILGSHASYQDFTVRASLTVSATYNTEIILVNDGQSDVFMRNVDVDWTLTQTGQVNVSGIYLDDQNGQLSDMIFEHVRVRIVSNTTNGNSGVTAWWINTDGVTLVDSEGYAEIGAGASADATAYGLQINLDDQYSQTVRIFSGEYHSENGTYLSAGLYVYLAGSGSTDVYAYLNNVWMHSDKYGLTYGCFDSNHYLILDGCKMAGDTQDIHQYNASVDVWPYVYACQFDPTSVDGDISELNYLDGDRVERYDAEVDHDLDVGGDATIGEFFSLTQGDDLTIAAGVITVETSWHRVDTQGGAGADDLDTINGGNDGTILILQQVAAARDVTLKDGVDNLRLAGDFTINTLNSTITLVKSGSNWLELSRSSN